jgi:hypothetical protein
LTLAPRHLVFGHAVFLDAAAFEAIYGASPNALTIEEARAALRRELGGHPRFDPAEGGDVEGFGFHGHGGADGGHAGD